MPSKQEEIREGIAGKIIVDCGWDSEYPCPHAHPTMGYEKCPHLDENICMWQREQADQILSYLQSKGAMLKVKCPDCNWSQFVDEESVGMTPCYRCNSTGYITEPLIEEEK